MISINSVNKPWQPLSKVTIRDNESDLIEPLFVDQDFLERLNSCPNKDEQTELFISIIKNEAQFQGEVFQIKEVPPELPTTIDKLTFGVGYASYPPPASPAQLFEKV